MTDHAEPAPKLPQKPKIEVASRADFGPSYAGVLVTEDGKELHTHEDKQAYREQKRDQRAAEKHASIRAECGLRGITIVSELTRETGMTTELEMQCGCAHGLTFKASASRVSMLPLKKPYCPSCRFKKPALELQEEVAKRGGKLLSVYKDSTTKVKFQCQRGHKWSALPNNIMAGTWCPTCATSSVAGRAEKRFAEMAAERGMTLIDYANAYEPMTIERDGAPWLVRRTNFVSNQAFLRSGDVHVYRDRDGLAFAHIGTLPKLLPAAVVDLIARSKKQVITADAGAEAVAVYADHLENPGKLRFVNCFKNPHWQEPGIYSWGVFPIMHNTLVEVPQ